MPMRISSEDAQIMKSGSARFPVKGTNCVPACAFYWCCANGKDGESCSGFMLINGATKRHLQQLLGEDALEYVQNSYGFIERAIENSNFEGVEVVTRELSELRKKAFPEHEEKIDFAAAMMRGFSNIQGAVSPMAAPNLEEDAREATYPKLCFDGCKYITCPFRKEENFNKPCVQRWRPLKRSLNFYEEE